MLFVGGCYSLKGELRRRECAGVTRHWGVLIPRIERVGYTIKIDKVGCT